MGGSKFGTKTHKNDLQEDLKEYEVNPDIPSMKLYRCWDSKAIISEDEQTRSMNVKKQGACTASQAADLMWQSQFFADSS